MNIRTAMRISSTIVLVTILSPHVLTARPLESKRMERAKDLIADEEWVRAIDELKGAIADQKEANKDEALFWLARSENQARDAAAAVETIRRLERDFPASRWVKPARSLRIEIAQRLQRNDVLWYTAAAPLPPPAPTPAAAPFPAPALAPPLAPTPASAVTPPPSAPASRKIPPPRGVPA